MARKTPTPSTVKKLFAFSGNICAAPKCKNGLVEDNVVLGEICHIEAAEEEGARFNKLSNDDYRRSFENLVLLCESCHKRIDTNANEYSVETLREWKSKHESVYQSNRFELKDSLVEKSIKKYINIGDGNQIINTSQNLKIGTQIGTQNNYGVNHGDSYTDEKYRKVIPKLKKKIDALKENAAPPKKDVIDFRNNFDKNEESEIFELPFCELLYRKKNGRIKAEVESYETLYGRIDEVSDNGQKILQGFLKASDPEKKEVLKQQIKKKGQRQPAIITCDGFLINGNRRKMIFEELYEDTHQDPKFRNMRVVILPENVAELEIKQIENNYQLQEDGKSEYHGLNRALTIRDNIRENYSLESQILADPQHAGKEGKELKSAINEINKKYLYPLECVDRYLETFGRRGLYNTISEGTGDKEGRWQAFIDYSSFYYSTLKNKAKKIELGIKDGEEGLIEDSIFKIIRKRKLNSKELEKALGKVHSFVRGGNLKKYLGNPVAKKHLLQIAKTVSEDIPENEKSDKNGKPYSEREIDEKWGEKYKNEILGNLMQAYKAVNNKTERDKPVELLMDALKKLNHENLKIENMGIEHFNEALKLAKKISEKSEEIYDEVDHARGNLKKLTKKRK